MSDIGKKLKNVFKSAGSSSASTPTPPNPNAIQQGETYEHWGLRICGIATGSLYALLPCLQRVYSHLYKEQAANQTLQQQFKDNKRAEILQERSHIGLLDKQMRLKEEKKRKTEERIKELKEKARNINTDKKRVNKNERLTMIVGLCILIPLTVYLFIFYSSTFYSAFFRDPKDMDASVISAMFDPNAVSNALDHGITNLLFVLLAPVIFLGLGYVLHIFSTQESKTKYVKMAAILVVTFMFDCILAYKIGDQLHIIQGFFDETARNTEYTISLATKDINTWAVIFCGFIAYIIWGFVFDMTMMAYQKMDSNKAELKNINQTVADLQNQVGTVDGEIIALQGEMGKTENKIKQLTADLGKTVVLDYSSIRLELANFFVGWITQMGVLQCTEEQRSQADGIYKNFINRIG